MLDQLLSALTSLSSLSSLGGLADLPEPTHSPGEVREKADEILSRPEYRDAVKEPGWLEKWITDRVDDLGSLLDKLLGGATLGGALPNFVGILILLVLFGGVVGLIVWAVSSTNWNRRGGRKPKRDAVFVDVEEYRTVREWLSEAEEHERAGRWRQGLLCRYRALVTDLVERKVIPDTPGRTAGEFVLDMQASPRAVEVAPTFAAATELFEAAWYGGADTGPDERDRFAGLAERVLAGVRSSTSAAVGAVGEGGDLP